MVRLMTRPLRGGARSRRSASQSGATVATRGSLTLGCSEKSPVKRASMTSRSPCEARRQQAVGPDLHAGQGDVPPAHQGPQVGDRGDEEAVRIQPDVEALEHQPRKVRVPSPCSVPRAPSRARTSFSESTSPSQTPSQDASE